MTDIAPLPKGAPLEPAGQKPQAIPEEGHLPKGKSLTSVQPHALPLVAAAEPPQRTPDAAAQRLHVALTRSELTGTGNIVDIIV